VLVENCDPPAPALDFPVQFSVFDQPGPSTITWRWSVARGDKVTDQGAATVQWKASRLRVGARERTMIGSAIDDDAMVRRTG
jgi:hypothetical protein